MPSLIEFLETDLAKAAWEQGIADGLEMKAAGKGVEEEESYRKRLQAKTNRLKDLTRWTEHAMADTLRDQALIHILAG